MSSTLHIQGSTLLLFRCTLDSAQIPEVHTHHNRTRVQPSINGPGLDPARDIGNVGGVCRDFVWPHQRLRHQPISPEEGSPCLPFRGILRATAASTRTVDVSSEVPVPTNVDPVQVGSIVVHGHRPGKHLPDHARSIERTDRVITRASTTMSDWFPTRSIRRAELLPQVARSVR